MVFDTLVGRAIVGKELARSQGVTDPAEQLRLGLIGGLVGSPTLGLVATTAIARQKAQDNEVPDESPDSPPDSPSVKLVKVPDLGQYDSVAKAKASLEASALKPKIIGVYSVDDAADTILGQSPAAGDFVSKGTTIEIKVSRGAVVEGPKGKMPLVKGMSLDDAKAAIADAGSVSVNNISVVQGVPYNGAVARGVIMQNPDPGSDIDSQTQPTLMIMSEVVVPDITGMNVGEAIIALSSMRLTPELVPPNAPWNNVIDQSPKCGESVAMFSKVQMKLESPSPD